MKKSSIELLEAYIAINCNNIHIPKKIWDDAKAIHKKELIKFAEDWEISKLDSKEDLYIKTFS
jgi:hypothetical protein